MTIEQLIKKLEKIKSDHGDNIEVWVFDAHDRVYRDVGHVEYDEFVQEHKKVVFLEGKQ